MLRHSGDEIFNGKGESILFTSVPRLLRMLLLHLEYLQYSSKKRKRRKNRGKCRDGEQTEKWV